MKLRSTIGTGAGALAVALTLGITTAGPVAAKDYTTPDVPAPRVSTNTPRVGASFELRVAGFVAAEQVRVTLLPATAAAGAVVADSGAGTTGAELGTFTADETGLVVATVTLPDDLTPGKYHLEATGITSGRTQSIDITVLGADDVLPYTGADTLPLVVGGTATVGVGVALIVVSRKRRIA